MPWERLSAPQLPIAWWRIGVINRILQETAKYRKSIVIADVEPLNADDEKGSQADKSLGSCLTPTPFFGFGDSLTRLCYHLDYPGWRVPRRSSVDDK